MNLKNGFTSTTDFPRLTEVDAIIICVPTPLSKFKNLISSLFIRLVKQFQNI